MKLRQAFLLIALLLLGGGLCRGQTTFVTGNLTASAAVCTTAPSNTNHVTISTINFGGATFTASGGWAGTLSFYASGDGGISWQPLNVTPSNSTTPVTTTTTVGLWQANVSAYTHVCILASTFTSGTMAVRIHCSSISARAGGGGGTGGGGPITPPAGSLTGQTLTVAGASVVGASPGILDSPSSPISAATFQPACGTTNIGDRAHIMVLTGTTTVTIPLSTATNCANSIFYFLAQNTETFQPSGAEILDVYDGTKNYTACASGCTAPNLQIPAGSYATIDNGSGTTWHCLVETAATTGGGTSGTLDSITSAVASPMPLANAAFNIPWNWQLTGAGSGLSLGETAASTGGTITTNLNNQSVLQLQTATNSTASPLLVNQGTLTGAAAVPALQLQTTWNNAAVTEQGLLIQAACTACGANSNPLNILNATGASVFAVNTVGSVTASGALTTSTNVNANSGIVSTTRVQSPAYTSSATGSPAVFQGGVDGNATSALGAATFRGADNANNTSGAAVAGLTLLRGGILSSGNANAAAMYGATEIASGYTVPAALGATGDVVCSTTTQFQVVDCPTGAVNVIGIASTTGNPMIVVTYGTAPVRLTAAGTLGHTICLSATTAGQATDSGGTAACPTAGAQIGVIVATAGNILIGSGTSTATVALSTTYPLVQLHFR